MEGSVQPAAAATPASSVPAADLLASSSTAAPPATPPPAVDYLAVLKKKGVAPVLDAERKEGSQTAAQLSEIEAQLAALRAKEKASA